MSEVLRLKARLGKLQVRLSQLDLTFAALLKDLRYHLVPYYDTPLELDLKKAEGLLSQLREVQEEYRRVKGEIKKIREELGDEV